MARLPDADTPGQQVPWLPDERFELALDAHTGMASAPVAGSHVLTVTTHRAIQLGAETGKRTTSLVPLERVTGVEVIDATRPTERLTQGLIIFCLGALFGLISWLWLEEQLITLLVGGLPVLVSIYLLAGYVFPDTEGELVLHTGTYAIHQPLLTPEARRDSYLAAHRIYELMAAASGGRTAVPSPLTARADSSQQQRLESQPRWSSVWAPKSEPAPRSEAAPARFAAAPQPSAEQGNPRGPRPASEQEAQPRWSSTWSRGTEAGQGFAQETRRAQVAPPAPQPAPPAPQPSPEPPEPPDEPLPAPPHGPETRQASAWTARTDEAEGREYSPSYREQRGRHQGAYDAGHEASMAEVEEHRDELAPAAEQAPEETPDEERKSRRE